MTLSEYIEKREKVLNAVRETVMINEVAVSIIDAQITELKTIKVALEDGKIEGFKND